MNPLTEAKRLVLEQQKERGTKQVEAIVDGKRKKLTALGPYVPTPEREARAQRIIALRKEAHR